MDSSTGPAPITSSNRPRNLGFTSTELPNERWRRWASQRASSSLLTERALSTFPGQHHPVPYGQADRVKALLTRSPDEIERFQRESFPFPRKHDSIAYC